MSCLAHLRAAQMGQIYQACLLPEIGYASSVWHDPHVHEEHLQVLSTVQ